MSILFQFLGLSSLHNFIFKKIIIYILSFHIGTGNTTENVMLEDEEKEEKLQTALESQHKHFSKLMVAVRSSLDHKLQHQQLVLVDFIRWIEHRMNWGGQLRSIVDLDEIFLKLHPHFDFLDCKLIVDMSEFFLNDECFGEDKSLINELKEHMVNAKNLRSLSTVKQLKNDLKKIYFPYQTNLANMSHIEIKLHNPWYKATIEALYLLMEHLLPHKSKQSILKFIEIDTGSVYIKYFVHESKVDCLIAYAQGKLHFMCLIGIFALIINDNVILYDDENINFTFESALLEAAKAGHNEAVQFLLKSGVDVHHCNKEGTTALMLASEGEHKQVVQTLVSAGANLNIQDNEGWTALMRASEHNHLAIVNTLIQHGADPNLQKSNGSNALMIASFHGHYDIVQVLLQQKTDINYQRKDGWTALMLASQNNHMQVIELLLKENSDINTQKKDGMTALMLASLNGHTQVVKLLLQWNADVNIQTKDDFGNNALMVASQYGHLEVVECLLQSQVDPHLLAYDGSTAFSLAAYSGNRDLVNMLLDKVQPTTNEIEKAVVLSCYGGHPTLITFLSNKLPDLTNDQRELLDSCIKGDLGTVVMKTLDSPDTPLVLGLTPLMVASSCGHVDIVDALIQIGADVNKQESNWGFTPLFFAVRGGKSFTIVETLLERNANPNVIADKKTPLDDANYIKQESISKLLSKYGGQTREKVERTKEKESKSSLLALLHHYLSLSELNTSDKWFQAKGKF